MSSNDKKRSRRIMQGIEHRIPNMNNKAIAEIVGEIHEADFETLAETIAIMRAQYLKKVVALARLDKSKLNVNAYAEVRKLKLAFEESIESFNQLKHALERGHFKLAE